MVQDEQFGRRGQKAGEDEKPTTDSRAFIRHDSSPSKRRSLIAACCALAALTAQPNSAAEPRSAEANFTFVDAQPTTLTVTLGGSTNARIAVRNTGSQPGKPQFCVLLQTNGQLDCFHSAVLGANPLVDAGQVVVLTVRVSVTEIPLSGYLALQTFDAAGALVTMALKPLKGNPPFFPQLAWLTVAVGGGSAGLMCYLVVQRLRREGRPLSGKMGAANWDFTRSWASNVTVAGALLSAALSLTALPDQTRYLNKGGYPILNLLFTLLAGLAPLVYNAFRSGVWDATAPEGQQLQYQGTVKLFFVASGTTISAVTAQTMTLSLVICELRNAGMLSPIAGGAFFVLLIAITMCVLAYAMKTMYWTVVSQILHSEAQTRSPSAERKIAEDYVVSVRAPLPDWSPL